jgi:hypothetical protein
MKLHGTPTPRASCKPRPSTPSTEALECRCLHGVSLCPGRSQVLERPRRGVARRCVSRSAACLRQPPDGALAAFGGYIGGALRLPPKRLLTRGQRGVAGGELTEKAMEALEMKK